MPNIVNITNIPAPYRERVHELIYRYFDSAYAVIYCSKLEPNRKWKFKYGKYEKFFLTEKSSGYIHNNPSVWFLLNKLKPKIVITTGFNPTMIYSFIWCLINNAKHICFTDGTLKSEKGLTFIHKFIRKIIYKRTKTFVGSSKGSDALYQSYNIDKKSIFNSCLAVDNELFSRALPVEKTFTIMFSGQFIDRKMPLFFLEVAKGVKKRTGNCKVLILGNGILEEQLLRELNDSNIEYEYPGFIDQNLLPRYYSMAKIFLFPTMNDPWGIVANEAMSVSMPVITCENAGVANDLVIHNVNGYVLPLNSDIWADHVVKLLQDNELYSSFSANAYNKVIEYSYEAAAEGLINAINYTINV